MSRLYKITPFGNYYVRAMPDREKVTAIKRLNRQCGGKWTVSTKREAEKILALRGNDS